MPSKKTKKKQTRPKQPARILRSPQPERPKTTKMPKELPFLAKACAMLFFLGSALFFLIGIIIFFGANLIAKAIPYFATIPTTAIAIVAVFVGIIFVTIGIIEFFTARGLWQGKPWARILAIILSLLGFLGALISLNNGSGWTVLELVINGAIAGYLLFSQEAKNAYH